MTLTLSLQLTDTNLLQTAIAPGRGNVRRSKPSR